MEFLWNLFNSSGFMPHGQCYLWLPDVLWLNVGSDLLIGLSYFTIPVIMAYFIHRRSDTPFPWIFGLFATFIFLCGTTHIMAVWTVWYPDYRLEGAVKLLTGIASAVTAMALIPLVPRVLALRTPGELEQEVAERTQALKQANARLAQLLDEQAQTHAALRDSEQRLHLLTDALPILMAYVDSEQRYRFVNHTYAWVWRLPCEQILGRTVESLLGPEAYAMARPRIERALAGEPVSYDLVTTQPDGTQKYNLR